MNTKLYKVYRYGVGIIFPPRCPLCDQVLDEPSDLIHEKCENKLLSVGTNCCLHCGRKLVLRNTEECPECEKKRLRNAVTFRQGKSVWQYKGAIKQSMYRFKYSNKREYADYFAIYTARKYGRWIEEKKIQAILPVPMYRKKERSRGYNQANVFARALGRELGIPVLTNYVIRNRDTKPMKSLNQKERKKNLQNAFQIRKNIVKYSYILIVDDIYTTGSTADALTEVILQAGVKEVYFLSICTGQEI